MNQRYRTLQPSGVKRSTSQTPSTKGTDPESLQDAEPSQSRIMSQRRNITAVACKTCQQKKSKCDGQRPVCGGCKTKQLACDWEIGQGLTRSGAIKRQNDDLQREVSSLLEIYDHLREGSPAEANALLYRIRSGTDTSALLDTIKQNQPDVKEWDFSEITTRAGALDPQPIADPSPFDEIDHKRYEEEALLNHNRASASATLKLGIERFSLCGGTIFPILSREDQETLEREIIEPFGTHGIRWISQATEERVRLSRMAAFSELCGLAAVGLLYNQDTLPSSPQSTPLEMAERRKPLYRLSRRFLDEAIENNPLRAMRVCASLTTYNMIAHSTVALAYCDLGISLGTNHGMEDESRLSSLDSHESIGYEKSYRTLIMMQRLKVACTHLYTTQLTLLSWLNENFDYDHNNAMVISHAIRAVPEDEILGVETVVQDMMRKVTMVKANILCSLFSSMPPSNSVLKGWEENLSRWHAELPAFLRLENITQQLHLSENQRRTIFYMHLFHLSAVLLKGRAANAGQVKRSLAYDSQEVRQAVKDGLAAARLIAQFLDILLIQDNSFQKSWLCVFSAYIAFIYLAFAVTKSMAARGSNNTWKDDIGLAKRCLDVLASCSSADPIANNFAKEAKDLQSALETAERDPPGIGAPQEAEASDFARDEFLFAPVSGQSSLHNLVGDLVRILCHPFRTLPVLSISHTLTNVEEISFGSHLNWFYFVSAPFRGDSESMADLLAQKDIN
ncbi:MAG: hypothetical protein Q9167_004944 [Letrouitia subvulpina]